MSNYVTFPVLRQKPMTWQPSAYALAATPVEMERVTVTTPDAPSDGLLTTLQDSLSKMVLQEHLFNTKKIQSILQAQADTMVAIQQEQTVLAGVKKYEAALLSSMPKLPPYFIRQQDPEVLAPKYTEAQIVAAMEHAVAKRGPNYINESGSTTVYAGDDRCIQGEMLVDLGFHEDTTPDFPGAWSSVARLFGYDQHSRVAKALLLAQVRNDAREPWGDILVEFKKDLGLAA